MAKKVENKDIFGKDVFSKTTDQVIELINALDRLEDKTVKTGKKFEQVLDSEDNKTFKSVKKTEEAIKALNDAEEVTLKIRKEKAKLQNKLATLTNDEVQKNAQLRVIIQEQNKSRKEQAKETLGLVGAYEKQSKKLNQLRKDFKNLRTEEGKATKETDALQREIQKLDKELKEVDASAGQFQRNVGNYPDKLDSATSSLVEFAAGAVAAKVSLDGLEGALENTEEGSEALRETTSSLGGIWDQASNAAASFALDAVDVAKGLGDGSVNAFDLAKSIGLASIGMSSLDKSSTKVSETFKRTNEATTDFIDKAKASAEANAELERKTIAFEKAIRPLETRLAKLNGLIEQQQIIAGDSTQSFSTLNDAILKGQELQEQRAAINFKIATQELALVKEQIRIKNLAGKAGVELLDKEKDATIKLIEAQNDLKNETLENEKELRQIKQDRLEIDLDILIDGFDNQKTINERIIANEKETLDERRKIFEETTRLAEESFRGQKEVLEDLSAAGIDVDELLLLDATALAKQIQQLEQSEIINTRTLEVIRERKIVVQDLKDAEEELNEASQEGLDLRADILAQEEALGGGSLDDLETKRIENQKASIRRRLELTKEGSIEELTLRKELNDLLLDEQQKLNDAQEKLEKESLAKQKELIENSISALSDVVNENANKRISELEKEITNVSERADQLRSKAEAGNLEAEQSLAVEEKRQAELELEKQKERKRQEKAQAFFSVLTAFNKNDGDIGKTVADVTVLKALAGTLSAFDGVDDTGGRGNVDSKGGKIWTLHPNEQVWSKKDRDAVGFRSRDEIKDIVGMYDRGLMDTLSNYDKSNDLINPSSFILNGMDTKGLESIMDNVNDNIKKIEMPKSSLDADYVRGLLTITTRVGNKKTKEVSKLFGRG